MCEIALPKCHKEADALNLRHISAKCLKLLVVKKVHVFLSNFFEVILALYAHCRDFHPFTIFKVAARCRYFTKVNLRVEVGSKWIAMVSTVAVKDINCIYPVKIMLLCVSSKYAGYTRIKACSKKGCKSSLLIFLSISPLIRVVKKC